MTFRGMTLFGVLSRFLRSLIFQLAVMVTLLPMALFLLCCCPFSQWSFLYRIAVVWTRWCIRAGAYLGGIRWRIYGEAHLQTDQPTVLLVKHQSTWETWALLALMPKPVCFVYKKELKRIPFFGWALARLDMVAIDRQQGNQAFHAMVTQGRRVLAQGRWIVIFPEGARMRRWQVGTYKQGGARLAIEAGAQVIPIAVTSARCWPRGRWLKTPGTIDVVVGEPLVMAGLTPQALMAKAKAWIEDQMDRHDPHPHPETGRHEKVPVDVRHLG
jgi:1-acyl-sn-glycerol-3-phosphate acyltransferase